MLLLGRDSRRSQVKEVTLARSVLKRPSLVKYTMAINLPLQAAPPLLPHPQLTALP